MSLDFTVSVASADDLGDALRLLEAALRDGEPLPGDFVGRIHRATEEGWIEVLAAGTEAGVLGVLVVAYRPNVAAGVEFASIEDLYVVPEYRRRGVGRALLEAAGERCASRGVSYVEVQVEEADAREFYASLGYEAEDAVGVLSRSLALRGAG